MIDAGMTIIAIWIRRHDGARVRAIHYRIRARQNCSTRDDDHQNRGRKKKERITTTEGQTTPPEPTTPPYHL